MQGVGFRVFTRQRARELGVLGTVRNLPNGTVEVRAEGAREALEQFRARVLAGPTYARVDLVEEYWDEGGSRHTDFRILA